MVTGSLGGQGVSSRTRTTSTILSRATLTSLCVSTSTRTTSSTSLSCAFRPTCSRFRLVLTRLHVTLPLNSTLREVVLVPNRQWGGEGLLGAGIGTGILHRIPKLRPEEEEAAGLAQANGRPSGER